MLACSYFKVKERLKWAGRHTAPFSSDEDGEKIANAYRTAIYAPDQDNEVFFGLPQPEFRALVYERKFVWAPDGDEAFDDGSFVLHFDAGDQVRLIGFKTEIVGYRHEQGTLRDLSLGEKEFYGILSEWTNAFEKEWWDAPKAG